MSDKVENIFKECHAIRKGHFVLKSQQHSDTYLEKCYLSRDPPAFKQLCLLMAQEVYIKSFNVDVVVGPVPVGMSLAQEVAYNLGELYQKKVYSIFAEKDVAGKYVFRKCFHQDLADKNILIVDDILTSGASVTELIGLIIHLKGKIAAVAVLCDRGSSTSKRIFESVFPLISLWKMELTSWPEKDCSLCKNNITIDSKF